MLFPLDLPFSVGEVVVVVVLEDDIFISDPLGPGASRTRGQAVCRAGAVFDLIIVAVVVVSIERPDI